MGTEETSLQKLLMEKENCKFDIYVSMKLCSKKEMRWNPSFPGRTAYEAD